MAEVVCIGAHPDDVEIGMGATVAQMVREGVSVAIVDLTDGEPTPFGTPERRATEAAEAARALGVERVTLGLPNRSLSDTLEARRALAEVLRALRPRIVVGPYPRDAHPDHVAASALAIAGRFYAKLSKSGLAGEPHYPARVYQFAAVHSALALTPSFVVPVDEEAIAAKRAALLAYRSQFVDNPANTGLIERVELQTRYWGSLVGAPGGEPFFATEVLAVASLTSLR
jgi:bacillithiol biosynthesis deacetylase BshB1